MEEIIKLLWEASESFLACRVVLQGEPFPRVIHPYGVARTSKNKIVLVCQQSTGFTKAGGKAGYRNLMLKRIESVEILKEKFEVSDDFNPSDIQYNEWIFHV
ncbi:hypothetical protein [Ekhidna sp.]